MQSRDFEVDYAAGLSKCLSSGLTSFHAARTSSGSTDASALCVIRLNHLMDPYLQALPDCILSMFDLSDLFEL